MAEITDEQARQKAAELILTDKTLKQAELPADLAEAIRKLVSDTFGIDVFTEHAEAEKAEESKHDDSVELDRQLYLEAQYFERLDTLKHYGFLTESGESKEGDVPVPSFEKAISTFEPEELEIASHFQKPLMLLVPVTSFTCKVKALDTHKQGMQDNNTDVSQIFTDSDSGSDKITGWRVFIVEGAQEMPARVRDYGRFNRRIDYRKKRGEPSEKGMDRHRYILLMMEALKKGCPIDKKSYTLLNDDPVLSDSHVPAANFDTGLRGVVFSRFISDGFNDSAWFRSSVGGDELIS